MHLFWERRGWADPFDSQNQLLGPCDPVWIVLVMGLLIILFGLALAYLVWFVSLVLFCFIFLLFYLHQSICYLLTYFVLFWKLQKIAKREISKQAIITVLSRTFGTNWLIFVPKF